MLDSYLVLRDALVQAVQSAWDLPAGTVIWVTEQQALDDSSWVAAVRRSSPVTFKNLNGLTDEAELTFTISGRFPIEPGSDLDRLQMERALALRDRLSYGHFTEVTDLPLVVEIDSGRDRVEEDFALTSLTFRCLMTAARQPGVSP